MNLTHKLKSALKRFSFHSLGGSAADWDQFYQRFEDRFRGSQETIRDRLKTRYEKRLRSLIEQSKAFKGGVFIDLGCGRGEMLSIAKEIGFKTLGVDESPEAVKRARDHGHVAQVSDLLTSLQSQPDESAVVISLFQVVEHCPPEYVFKVYRDAYRVLKPGGVFIVETPSLFSLWAGHRQFYLDPTHTRPVHPDFLKFMGEDCGFSSNELIEFGPVKHVERANLSQSSDNRLREELQKLEKWLYGPMDITCWAVK